MSSERSGPLRAKLEAICEQLLPAAGLTSEQRANFIQQLELTLRDAKLEAMAEFAAGAGHEINNPVATIAGRSQLLLAGETDPERRHALEVIGGQALRIRDMIGDAMLFGRPPQPRCEDLDLATVAAQAVASQSKLQLQQAASVTVTVPEKTQVWADKTQLLVLISSLLRNCLEAADRPGIQVQITSRADVKNNCSWTVMTITDDGPGFTPETYEHLFDPFFSGRQAGRGLGFGLSKCWRIAKSHGGEIIAKNLENGGAAFEVWLPQTR